MHLGTSRCGKADENYDPIATGIHGEVNVDGGFPVVDEPDITRLVAREKIFATGADTYKRD